RQEASLAKVEIRDTGAALVGDARNVGIAAGLALAGTLCIVAFLVLALGNLLDGRYWLSALIVGAVALVAGMLLAKNAVNDIKTRGLKPQQTLDTLREDKVWAGQAARELGHDLKADPTKTIERR
ncbi:MAG: phage holin family protein, partial [Gemmatimonas sp.]